MDKQRRFYFFVIYIVTYHTEKSKSCMTRSTSIPYQNNPEFFFGITSPEITDQFLNTLNIKVRIDTLTYYSESMAPNG